MKEYEELRLEWRSIRSKLGNLICALDGKMETVEARERNIEELRSADYVRGFNDGREEGRKEGSVPLDNHYAFNIEQWDRHSAIRKKEKELRDAINLFCPEGRDRSLALTKLDEAIMWADTSIVKS